MEISFNQPSSLLQTLDDSSSMAQTAQTKAEIQKLTALITDLDAKVNILLENSEKMRKSASRSMWLTIIFVVLPIAISIIAIPFLMKTLTGSMGLSGGDSASSISSLLEQLQKGQ